MGAELMAIPVSVLIVGVALATLFWHLNQGLAKRVEKFDDRLRSAEGELAELRGRMMQGVVTIPSSGTMTVTVKGEE